MTQVKQRVGDGIEAENAGWSFSGDVCEHFDSHVNKSVPLYNEGHDLILKVSDFFVGDGSTVYDLGASTGTLSALLAKRHADRDVRIFGVDREAEMVAYSRRRCAGIDNIEMIHADVTTLALEKSDFIVMYYTLQFIPPKLRQIVVDAVYQALDWGGAFLLFEKVRAPDARFQDIAVQLYQEYKLDNGFSSNDIIGKSRSLKRVLEPFSSQGNLDLLGRAGFVDITTIQKYVCFEGFLAIK